MSEQHAPTALRGLEYQPALDGVRAVSVTMVLLFHAGLSWMRGGYLGVSVFFTLSGFLITSLLLNEASGHGTVDFRRFYSRRLKRLLPASTLCLAGIVIARWMGEFRLVGGLRGQLLGALGQVYNWVQIAGSSSYTALFSRSAVLTSPVEHYWSLAIEEQFYMVWPLALWAIVRRARRRGTDTLRSLLLLTVVFGMAAPAVAALSGPDVAYWSTPTRLAELLVGASAAAWHRRGGRLPAWGRWTAVLALAALVALGSRLPTGSGPAYSGWMLPIAMLSGLLLLSLQVPGTLRTTLATAPVVWVGKVSYGLYLFHWPVFLLLRQHGWRLDRPAGFALALAITVAISAISFYALEQPIRRSKAPSPRTFRRSVAAAVAVALAIAVMPVGRGFLEANQQVLDDASIQPDESVETLVRVTVAPTTSSTAPPSTTPRTTTPASTTTSTTVPEPVTLSLPPAPNRPVRILVVGDSTAFYVGQGLAAWAVEHPAYAQVDLLWCQGCGFILDGTITSFEGHSFVERSEQIVHVEMPQLVTQLHPDVVLLMTTVDDVTNRVWDPAEGPLAPYDPLYRERMTAAYRSVTDSLVASGVPSVVWVVPPVPNSLWEAPEMGETERYLVQHEVIREVTASAGAGVLANELDDWINRAGHSRDDNWRPDGTHLTEDSAKQLAEDYLGPWLIAAALGVPAS